MMTKTKSRLTKILEKIFPKTMHSFWWKSRSAGRNYGINLTLMILNEEMKRLHKQVDIPSQRVKAKEEAKFLQHLITEVRKLQNVH